MAKKAFYPPLTKEQQELVRDNHKFVFRIAASFRRLGHQDDLISEGYLGLCIAATKFEPSRGLKFTTFSAYWIRAKIFDYLLRTHGPTHILSSDRPLFFKLLRAQNAVLEKPETDAELAARLGTDVQTLAIMQERVRNHDVMLDAPLLHEGRPIEMVDRELMPEESYSKAEEMEAVAECVQWALGQLDPRSRRVIQSRAMADEPKTLERLARSMGGLSRERVRQIEKKAKAKLRRLFLQAGLPPLLAMIAPMPTSAAVPTATVPQVRARRA